MAQTIYIKNSELAGATPSSLNKGEIAINISDGNLFYGDAGGNVSQNFSFLNSGATSIGALTATSGTFRSNVNISGDTHFPNNAKALFGTDIDLKIYHSGSHSIIQDTGVGDLHVKGSIVKIKGTSTGEDCAVFTENGSVELYYDNAKKFETASGGVNIGSLAAGAVVTAGEEGLLTSNDFLTWDADTGTLTSLNIVLPEDGNLRSNVATGTAPFTVASTTVVANLHATSATSVMTNANLTGDITSVGNVTTIASGIIINADVKSDAAIDYSKLAALSDGNILVGNGSNVATSVNPSGDIDVTNAGVFSIASGVVINADVKSDAAIDYSKLAALSDGNILVGNGSNVATSVNPSGDVDITNAGVFSIASGVIIDADVKSDAAIAQTKLDTNVDLGGDITFGNQLDDTVFFKGDISAATVSGSYQYVSFFSSISGAFMDTNNWILPSAGGGISNHTWNNDSTYAGSNNTVGVSNFTPGNGTAHLGIPVPVTGFLEGFFCNCRNNGSANEPRNGGLFVGTNNWGVAANAYTLQAYAAGDDDGGTSNSKPYKVDGMLTTGYPVTKGDLVLPAMYAPDDANKSAQCTWTIVFKA